MSDRTASGRPGTIGAGAGQECPRCGAPQMPRVAPDSLATARACQACGWVEELKPPELPPRYVKAHALH